MPLPTGSRFGPYEVTAQLGQGGMGEVYRAHDTRLGRDVALKVLHSEVAQSSERRTRFEREARSVAALNHPNIVAIFDIGEQDGIVYFVSELVEGESLRARIQRGAFGARELLEVGVQMADGISAAHAAGIMHRDLKPENVMLTRDGRIKILDFGLARPAASAVPAAADRTVTINETIPGTVLGTANYMSPEQVRGLAVDYRSDQFSFGVILYEMATGKQAFQRESAILTMSAVVTDEAPAIDPVLQAKLPAPLRWTMQRCLAKDPARRYESTRDLYEELRQQREHFSEALPALPDVIPAAPGRATPWSWKLTAGLLALAVLGLGFALYRSRGGGEMIENYRFTPFAVSSEGQSNAVWAPDGKSAAYLGEVNGVYQIFVRYLSKEVPVQLTSQGVRGVLGWSGDSRRIYFWTTQDGQAAVYSVAAVGGDPQRVMPAPGILTGDISPDGKTLAVLKVDEDGYRRIYTSSPVGATLQRYPSDKFSTNATMGVPRIRFAPDGKKLLYLFFDGLERRWLVPFPAGSGEPREVLASLPQYGFTPAFSWFPDSRHLLVSLPAHLGDPGNLWIADVSGAALHRLTSTPSAQYLPAVSPDGKRILYQEIGSDLDVAKVSLTDGKTIRLISTDRDESMPAWAASSGKFAYVTRRNGPPEIWLHDEDGSDRPLVTPADFVPAQVDFFMNPTLTPDGDRVIYTMLEVGGKPLMYISSTSGGAPTRVTNAEGPPEFAASLSPDGKQLVYVAWGAKPPSIRVVKTSGQATATVLRENAMSGLPQWSPAGEWITFEDKNGWHLISPDGKIIRDLGAIKADTLAFSLDGRKLYGIRGEKEHQYLFSLDVNGSAAALKTIADLGKDFAPSSDLNPGYRLSVAPDGTCAIYSVATIKSSIWMLEGFRPIS